MIFRLLTAPCRHGPNCPDGVLISGSGLRNEDNYKN